MRIGITCNIRTTTNTDPSLPHDFDAEFDSETTIQAMESAIASGGHTPVRIGDLQALTRFLVEGQSVDLVFNVAEGVRGRARESQVPSVLDAYGIPYTMSDPLTLAISLDKALTKRLWCEHNLPTPASWVITPQTREVLDTVPDDFPLFVKPAYEGSSKGINQESRVTDRASLQMRVNWLLDKYQQPVLIEPFLPGREYTVGLLGNGSETCVLGIAEITAVRLFPVNGFDQKEHMKDRPDVFVALPTTDPLYATIEKLALAAFKILGCYDVARLDVRLDADGNPQLLEINPIAGLNPTHSALPAIARFAGMRYDELIQNILDHAVRRYGLA
jgi:D-alanine-D-alanine ligase